MLVIDVSTHFMPCVQSNPFESCAWCRQMQIRNIFLFQLIPKHIPDFQLPVTLNDGEQLLVRREFLQVIVFHCFLKKFQSSISRVEAEFVFTFENLTATFQNRTIQIPNDRYRFSTSCSVFQLDCMTCSFTISLLFVYQSSLHLQNVITAIFHHRNYRHKAPPVSFDFVPFQKD